MRLVPDSFPLVVDSVAYWRAIVWVVVSTGRLRAVKVGFLDAKHGGDPICRTFHALVSLIDRCVVLGFMVEGRQVCLFMLDRLKYVLVMLLMLLCHAKWGGPSFAYSVFCANRGSSPFPDFVFGTEWGGPSLLRCDTMWR